MQTSSGWLFVRGFAAWRRSGRSGGGDAEVPLGSNCNFYAGYWGTGTACAGGWRDEAWCADFAKYVWRHAGASVVGLDASTESFRNYGLWRGTWHPTLAGMAIFDDDNDPTSTYHLAA